MKEHNHTEHACQGPSTGRRNFMRGCGAAAALAVAGLSAGTVAGESADIEELLADLPTNWGEWGDDDEIGALNYLGSEEMFRGARAMTRRGSKGIERITLQLPMTGDTIDVLAEEDAEAPTTETGDPLFPGRTPGRRDNTQDAQSYENGLDPEIGGMKFADDRFLTELFLHGASHLDALGHVWYGDELYNGYDAATTATEREFDRTVTGLRDGEAVDVDSTRGLSVADIGPIADAGVAGRGVLLDVGRHMGDDENGWLDLGEPITLEDLRDTADAQGVRIRKRDILLVRTGAIERVTDPEAEWDPLGEPGLKFSEGLVEWIDEMEIPLIGADNIAVEKVVQEIDGVTYVIPLHGALLRDLGVSLNEVLDLSTLGIRCAEDEIYEFMYTAAPLHVERSTGAPVNPVVMKATKPEGERKLAVR